VYAWAAVGSERLSARCGCGWDLQSLCVAVSRAAARHECVCDHPCDLISGVVCVSFGLHSGRASLQAEQLWWECSSLQS
jgi:hypothetical protein